MSARHPDAIVVGAGVIGLFTAWELRKAGLSVLVLERGTGREGASWAGGGILSPLHPWRYPEAVLALAGWSQRRYRSIAESLVSCTGIDPEWTQSGLLMLEPEAVSPAGEWARRSGAALETLTPEDLQQRFPGITAPAAGLFLPDVAQIRNPRLLQALGAQLQLEGVELRMGTDVSGVLTTAGRANGVETSDGAVQAKYVVICAGAWSGQFLPPFLQPRPVKGEMLLYAASAPQLPAIVLRDEYYLVPRRDGRVLAGSTIEERGFDTQPTPAARRELMQVAESLCPALRGVEIEQHWAGLRPGTAQAWPWIGACPGVANLFVNTGHFRHGLTTAPASARLLADRLLGRAPDPALAGVPGPT